MTAAEAVRTFLLTLTPVTALVNARITTLRWPQKPTLPAVLVQQISDGQDPHLRGTSGLRRTRIQIDCLAVAIKDARALDQAVIGTYTGGAATGLRGAVAVVSGAVSIKAAQSIGYREVYEADELREARTIRDYEVWIEGLD